MRRPGWTAGRIGPAFSAEQLDRALQLTHPQRQTPEARGTIFPAGALDDVLRLCHQLKDLLAEPEERLARRPRGRRLLTHAAQVKARRLQRFHAPVERRRHRDDVVDREHPVRMRDRRTGRRPL